MITRVIDYNTILRSGRGVPVNRRPDRDAEPKAEERPMESHSPASSVRLAKLRRWIEE